MGGLALSDALGEPRPSGLSGSVGLRTGVGGCVVLGACCVSLAALPCSSASNSCWNGLLAASASASASAAGLACKTAGLSPLVRMFSLPINEWCASSESGDSGSSVAVVACVSAAAGVLVLSVRSPTPPLALSSKYPGWSLGWLLTCGDTPLSSQSRNAKLDCARRPPTATSMYPGVLSVSAPAPCAPPTGRSMYEPSAAYPSPKTWWPSSSLCTAM